MGKTTRRRSIYVATIAAILALAGGFVFASLAVTSTNTPQQNGYVVNGQNLPSVHYTSVSIVPEPYTAAPMISTQASPVIIIASGQSFYGPGPSGQGSVQGDIATQIGIQFTANPNEEIGVTVQIIYQNVSGPQVLEAQEYVELANGTVVTATSPLNFNVSFDLGSAYTLQTVDIVLTAYHYVNLLAGTTSLFAPPAPAAGAVLKVAVSTYVTYDVDSGYAGYWALDNYTKTLTVWYQPSNATYYFVESYTGTSTTYSGIVSPGSIPGATCVQEGATGVAYMSGYISGWVTAGTYNPTLPTTGFVGNYNYGGSKANLGACGAGYTGSPAPNPVDLLGHYFNTGYTYTTPPWALTYFYQGQTWVDANYVTQPNSGNIVT
ncbi:MAG: hypothetical protein JRN35_06805 [Nitrososphaerota archaeon]|jgi:hypothetical protein|nr:hypothetical protein [Nitrososphaerota archaeon]